MPLTDLRNQELPEPIERPQQGGQNQMLLLFLEMLKKGQADLEVRAATDPRAMQQLTEDENLIFKLHEMLGIEFPNQDVLLGMPPPRRK